MIIARRLVTLLTVSGLVFCGLILSACQQAPSAPVASEQFDVVVLGGKIVDPESRLEAVRNIGIRGGRIAAISEQRLIGRIELDAARKVVAPGFIDLHSHGMVVPSMWMQAFDGVTTALDLEGGSLPIPEAKGRIKVGADADIIVFDPDTVVDKATYANPRQPAEGMRHVIVSGVPIIRDGKLDTTVMPGRPVRGPVGRLPKSTTAERAITETDIMKAALEMRAAAGLR